MTIKQLTEEQTRTMTPEEKDRWWLENVYKGAALVGVGVMAVETFLFQ